MKTSRTTERIRAALPSDTRLWMIRDTFALSGFAMSLSADVKVLRGVLEDRGWIFTDYQPGQRARITHAPCRVCGAAFEVGTKRLRVCDVCAPPAAEDPNAELYEFERARVEAKRRTRRLAISAMLAGKLDAGDPLRKKPGRPRKAEG